MKLNVELTFWDDSVATTDEEELRRRMEEFLGQMRAAARGNGLAWAGTTGYEYERNTFYAC